jgi:hypothetical protein
LRTHQEVLSQLLHALLDAKYNTPTVFCLAGYSTTLQVSPHRFNSGPATLPFCANSQTLQLLVGLWYSTVWYVAAWPPQPLGTHRLALFLSFRTATLSYYLPPFYGRDLLSAHHRVKSNPSLFRWTISGASLWETLLWDSYLPYPYMDAKPPILIKLTITNRDKYVNHFLLFFFWSG